MAEALCVDQSVSRPRLDAWAETYGTQHRQLRRWIARGRERNDPCPLDDPARMPIWWERNMEKPKHAPPKVMAAAEAARPRSPVAESAPAPSEQPSVVAVETPSFSPLDLASVGGVEGEAVTFYRSLFAAAKQQVTDAYSSGMKVRIHETLKHLEGVGDSLRKHEAAAEAKAKRRGELLTRSDVVNEVAAAINVFKLMHENMISRVLSDVSDLSADHAERLRLAMARAHEREIAVFQNLKSVRSEEDVSLLLAH